jgi:hypothetical protein
MFFKGRKCKSRNKKVVDLNDKNNITQLSKDIETVIGHKSLTTPLKQAIIIMEEYDENHDLSIEQIRKIYSNLNINERMSPEQMDKSLECLTHDVVILEKKFLKASIEKTYFSAIIRNILSHFSAVVAGNILGAITDIIENFSCICLMAKKEFSYKDVCFKFFSRQQNSDEVLVLVLNIHYEQSSLKYKILNIFKRYKERIDLNFLGALVKTDVPELSQEPCEPSTGIKINM